MKFIVEKRIEKSCAMDIPTPNNGKIVYSSNSSEQPNASTSRIICDPGYVLSGPKLLTCMDGRWVPNIVTICMKDTIYLGKISVSEAIHMI